MVSRSTIGLALLICILFLGGIRTSFAGNVTSNKDVVNITNGSLKIGLSRLTGQSKVGRLMVTEGVGAVPVKFDAPRDWKISSGSASHTLREVGGGLRLQVGYKTTDSIRINLAFQNTGKTQRLLEVSYSVFTPGANFTWWDGRDEAVPGTDERKYERIFLRLPMSVVYNNKSAGTAIGLDPHHLSSFFASGATKVQNGLLASFTCRIVLDPDQKLTLPLYAFSFTPRYGHLDAMDKLYDMYPDLFEVDPEVRPELNGRGGGYFWSGKAVRHLQCEDARRFNTGWDWVYAPIQRTGMWYPNESNWDPDADYPGYTDTFKDLAPGTLEHYRAVNRDVFHRGWPSAALVYYTMFFAAETNYMKKYPDGLLISSNGKSFPAVDDTAKGRKGDKVVMTYPWGNSHGRQVAKEIAEIANDFQPGGIGFDVALLIERHYGSGIEGDSARAWDDTGVFCSLQVALARLMDVVHEQKVRGHKLAVVNNAPWTYMTAVRSDAILHEILAYTYVDGWKDSRPLFGRKAATWWDPMYAELILNWESMTPEQIREGLTRLSDYQRLNSLKYGYIPMNFQIRGIKSLFDLMPILHELCAEGWQPVSAVKCDNDLWLSRYGKGLRSFISVGNGSKQSQKALLKVYTNYLGKGHFLYSTYKGTPLSVKSSNGVAHLDMGTLAPYEHSIARSLVALISDGNVEVDGKAWCSNDPMVQGKIAANWLISGRSAKSGDKGTIHIRVPDGAHPTKLVINKVDCRFTLKNGVVAYTGNLPSNGNMEMTYRPMVVVECSEDAILKFPFLTDEKPSCTVVVPGNSVETDRFSAQRISSYFEWYFHKKAADASGYIQPMSELPKFGKSVVIPITVGDSISNSDACVEIRPSNGMASIKLSPDGSKLIIEGSSPKEREAAVLRLLSILDKKYPFYSGLSAHDLYKKAGLAGKIRD